MTAPGTAPAGGQASPLLCDNDDVMSALMRALSDPGSVVPRAPLESLTSWQRRAIVEGPAAEHIGHAALLRISPELRETMRERDQARAELAETQRIHNLLIESILQNADEDFRGADEAPEYVAEEYVRWLEGQRLMPSAASPDGGSGGGAKGHVHAYDEDGDCIACGADLFAVADGGRGRDGEQPLPEWEREFLERKAAGEDSARDWPDRGAAENAL